MTISSTTRTAGPFTGNGTTSTFSFAFKVFQAPDLIVSTVLLSTGAKSALALNTDYTVAFNASQDTNPGGSVTLTAGPLATGYTLTIVSGVSQLQLTELSNQGGYYPEVLTAAFDRATILIQQLQVAVSNPILPQPCATITVGTTYRAPAKVLAVFVNGLLQAPGNYSVADDTDITLNYTAAPEDVVHALCPFF